MVDGPFGNWLDEMNILGVIPARGGSKEIPMKNLVKIHGKPLLYYTVHASVNSSKINKTIVSTDNENIAKYGKKLGAEIIKRPKNLSGNKIGIEPSITHTLNVLKKQDYVPDLIVVLQNTSPFRNSDDIDKAINVLVQKKLDSVVSVFTSHDLIWSSTKNVSPLNYDVLQRPNRQQMKNQFIENGAIYVTKYDHFIKNKIRISGKIGLYVMPPEKSLQIDSPLDLQFAELIIRNQKK